MSNLFFELIRVSLGTQECLSRTPSKGDWGKMFMLARKQSMVGICFSGVQKICAGFFDESEAMKRWNCPQQGYLLWMELAVKILKKNEEMNKHTEEVQEFFRSKGCPTLILKGQGIAKLYGDLALLRNCGDIDIWISGGRKKAIALSMEQFGKVEGLTVHHIHFPLLKDIPVELHFKPSFLSSPLRNRRFMEFCRLYEPKDCSSDVPSLAFNRVFILLHCYRHLCGHGVGMRQLIDYYFVLKSEAVNKSTSQQDNKSTSLRDNKSTSQQVETNLEPRRQPQLNQGEALIEPAKLLNQGVSLIEPAKPSSIWWIEQLGMLRFCRAVMWIMKEVFGLEEKYLLCEPDEAGGKFLLNEVMHAGNMGHDEDRFDSHINRNALLRYWYNLKRDIRLIKLCPHEALWDPIYNVYQFVWCKVKACGIRKP